jgi:hypothetical protein
LNRIKAQFTGLRYFALDGTDHPTHEERVERSAATSPGATAILTTVAYQGRRPGERCLTRH